MSSKIIAGTTSGTALNMSADTSGQLEIQTGATPTTAITVTSAQNVGIGTSSPSQLLELSSASNPCVMMTDTTNTVKAYMFAGNLAAYMGSATNHPTVFQVNDSEKMRIDTSGNLGIATDTPTQKLDVLGTIQSRNNAATNDATVGAYNFYNTNASASSNPIRASIVGGRENSNWGAYLAFNTSTGTSAVAERMRIDSTGNVLIGGTTANAANTLTIEYNSNCPSINFNTGFNGRNSQIFKYNSSQVGSIVTNSGSVSFNTTSDYRLKENVVPMTGALDTVAQLKPVTYTWKLTGESTQGFIAHELQAVVPDCVTGEKDAVDEEGNPVYQGIDTSFLVATLTAAIQELNAKVEAQAAEIQVLKGKA